MKIISGGQSGVDRAALDAARSLGIKTGGWCPRGGRCEDTINLLEEYPELQETPERSYKQRTEWNVRDADATIIFQDKNISPGTALTLRIAKNTNKPWILLQLQDDNEEALLRFLRGQEATVLNVAGPRESGSPGAYKQVRKLLETVLGEIS